MKSAYYQFVNYIQSLGHYTSMFIWLFMFAGILLLMTKFFKLHNGTQKKVEKPSLLILALMLFAVLIYFNYLRK